MSHRVTEDETQAAQDEEPAANEGKMNGPRVSSRSRARAAARVQRLFRRNHAAWIPLPSSLRETRFLRDFAWSGVSWSGSDPVVAGAPRLPRVPVVSVSRQPGGALGPRFRLFGWLGPFHDGAAGAADEPGASLLSIEINSTGSGKTMVVFFSTPISVRVCR